MVQLEASNGVEMHSSSGGDVPRCVAPDSGKYGFISTSRQSSTLAAGRRGDAPPIRPRYPAAATWQSSVLPLVAVATANVRVVAGGCGKERRVIVYHREDVIQSKPERDGQ